MVKQNLKHHLVATIDILSIRTYNLVGGDIMKKFTIGMILGLMLGLAVTAFAAVELNVIANPFPVLIDGAKSEVEGYNINGFTFLKLADFKKAGLTVKFNETDKQIEITKGVMPVSIIEQPTKTTDSIETPTPSIPVARESEFLKTVGLKGITYDGKEYVSPASITEKYQPLGFFDYDQNTKTFNFCNTRENITNKVYLISDIKPLVIRGSSYIEYSYYLNTILPLIK
jgi:hypothetical protein